MPSSSPVQTPVLVDIDPGTLNISPTDLERRIDEAKASGLTPKIVLGVDLFGAPADYSALQNIADQHGMTVWSDGAQSFGGRQNGTWVGAITQVTGTSFFPGKALGAYGDAGATFTQDDEMASLCQSIRWHGTDEKRALSVRVGLNGRMSSFQAAVLLEKAAIFWDELEARKRIAEIYAGRLGDRVAISEPPGEYGKRLRLLHDSSLNIGTAFGH